MTRTPLLAVALVALAALAAGCVRIPGGVAPSDIPVTPGAYEELGPVSAADCKVMLLGLLPVSGGNQVADAVKKARRQRDGTDALVGVSVDRVSKYFILWSQTCTEVRATAVRFR